MEIIDLTLKIEEGLVSFPGMQRPIILNAVTHSFSSPRYDPPCKGFASFQLIMNDHTGTHIDAPFHMCPDGDKLDDIELQRLYGEAVLLDFSYLADDEEVTARELELLTEDKGLTVKKNDIVIIKKWSGQWGEEGFFECKALDESAAQWLVNKNIKSIGINLPTVDVETQPLQRKAHIKFLSNDIYIVENLINLSKINQQRFTFAAMPLNINGISGSPTRAIAIMK